MMLNLNLHCARERSLSLLSLSLMHALWVRMTAMMTSTPPALAMWSAMSGCMARFANVKVAQHCSSICNSSLNAISGACLTISGHIAESALCFLIAPITNSTPPSAAILRALSGLPKPEWVLERPESVRHAQCWNSVLVSCLCRAKACHRTNYSRAKQPH